MKRLLIILAMLLFIQDSPMAACPFVDDDFNNGVLGNQWTAEARDGSVIEQSEAVQITSGSGNLWWDVFTPTRIYQCMSGGDFDVYTKVSAVGMEGQYQQAGILFDQGAGSWTSIMLRWDDSLQYAVQRRDSVGQSTSTMQTSVTGATVWLRMQRAGSTFTAYFSNSDPVSGNAWQAVDHGTVEYSSGGEGNIGTFAMHPSSVAFVTSFDFLKTWASTPAPDSETIELKFAWEHDGKDIRGDDITIANFPFYMTRTSGSTYLKLADVVPIGNGPTYTSEMIEFDAVEGEIIYFAVTAIAQGQSLESEMSTELEWTVPVTQPPEPECGDGNLDPGEQCDDGNLIDGDDCDSNCQKVPVAPLPPKTVRIIVSIQVPAGVNVTVETN